ncbi:Copper(I)-binding protein [Thermomonospora echinospora]|uniref:Copper(I)-binding protein n=1 Tax=Thermomonospora echinospora TaxID=1992 RepID=A0A1H6DKR8_9ACTN|nr:copper chaperone PCu(A)C [Thermomonospora echinospora]SEG85774.1 Copper(I)-binding protein [Thermomonospora echinospora]
MIRNSRRVFALTVAGAVAFAPVMSGCAAGHAPQTAMPTQLTEGLNVSVPEGAARSEIDIRNMFVLGPAAGPTATPTAGPAAPGSSVPLYGTFINQVRGRADRLVAVTSPSFRQAQITGGGVVLPAATESGGQAVRLFAQQGQTPPVVLQGLTTPLLGGETIRLTLRFEKAGSITVPVPVVPQQGEYATYAAVPTPTPAPTGVPPVTESPTVQQTVTPGITQTPVPTPTVPSASPH